MQQFTTRLRHAAKDCDFKSFKDNQIIDAILSKCTSDYVRRKLLEEGEVLTLNKTLEIAAKCECIEMQMSIMNATSAPDAKETVYRVLGKGGKRSQEWKNKHEDKNGKSDKVCYRCGSRGPL